MRAGPLGSSGCESNRATPGGPVVPVVRACAHRVQLVRRVVRLSRARVRQRGRSSGPGTAVSLGHDGRGVGGGAAAAAGADLAARAGRAARGLLPPQMIGAVWAGWAVYGGG